MGRVLKANFYYGAILTTILQKNPDAIPTLILADGESKQIYKMITNSSKHEYILFFKYASMNSRTRKNYWSCQFTFSKDDKEKLKNCYLKEKMPILICLLCVNTENFRESDIVILKYEEFEKVKKKQAITIGFKYKKHHFILYTDTKARDDGLHIETNRIEKNFDDLLVLDRRKDKRICEKKNLNDSKKVYPYSNKCLFCKKTLINEIDENKKIELKICRHCDITYIGKNDYKKNKDYIDIMYDKVCVIQNKLINRDTVSENNKDILYVVEKISNICPEDGVRYKYEFINFGNYKDTIAVCPHCGKQFIDKNQKQNILNTMNRIYSKSYKKYIFKDV